MSSFDRVVMGGGVAGSLAALDGAARGQRVALLHGCWGASALCGGAWDVGGEGRDEGSLSATCPWAGATLARVATLVPGLLQWRDEGPMPLVVSELGRARRTAAHDPALLDLSRLERARVAVATFLGHPSFDGRQVARALDREAIESGQTRRYAAVEIDFLRRGRDRVLHPHELAAELDLDPESDRRGRDARYVLSEAIRAALGGLSFDAVLMPPVLGLRSDDVRAELEAAVGLPIGEAIGLLPGAASDRLARRLSRALTKAEVEVHHRRVTGLEKKGPGFSIASEGADPIETGTVIVATGKQIGGGLMMEEKEARSPWGLPLAGQGVLRGIEVDEHGRIASQQGNLFACGAVLQGFDGAGRHKGLLDVARSALLASESASALHAAR